MEFLVSGAGGERGLCPLQDWHWEHPSLAPCLLQRARKKLLLCCGSQQCTWCSLLSSLEMLFLPNGHKVFGLNPLVPGQADVNDVIQRAKILCWKAWRGASICHKGIDNYVLHVLTTENVVNTDHKNMLSAKGIVVLENSALTGNAL